MMVEITEEEAKIVERAIELWEKEPQQGGLLGSVFSAMLSDRTPAGKAQHEEFMRERKLEEDREMSKRRLTAMRIRMKMLEAVANPREFDATQ